jgi:hypothetical protein
VIVNGVKPIQHRLIKAGHVEPLRAKPLSQLAKIHLTIFNKTPKKWASHFYSA